MARTRDPIAFLRKLALLAPLAALPACEQFRTITGEQTDPDPRPPRPAHDSRCPPSAPLADSACSVDQHRSRCHYPGRPGTQCRCEPASSRWECANVSPSRGPLPPPELST